MARLHSTALGQPSSSFLSLTSSSSHGGAAQQQLVAEPLGWHHHRLEPRCVRVSVSATARLAAAGRRPPPTASTAMCAHWPPRPHAETAEHLRTFQTAVRVRPAFGALSHDVTHTHTRAPYHRHRRPPPPRAPPLTTHALCSARAPLTRKCASNRLPQQLVVHHLPR